MRPCPVATTRLRADNTQPLFERLGLPCKQGRIIDSIRQYVLDVQTGFCERNGFGKDGALDGPQQLGTPLDRTTRPGVVTRRGQHLRATQIIKNHFQKVITHSLPPFSAQTTSSYARFQPQETGSSSEYSEHSITSG